MRRMVIGLLALYPRASLLIAVMLPACEHWSFQANNDWME